MRPTVNLLVALCYISLQDIVLNKAENIMLRKPSKMSGVYNSAGYANDGNIQSLAAVTGNSVNPFWQGDLQGWYTINYISVSSAYYFPYEAYLESAYVGVSADDSIDCPDVEIFVCGQCPASVGAGETFTFNCSHPRPVRFVKIWRDVTSLAVSEVEAEGTSTTQRGTKYQKGMNTKVQTPMTSLTVASANECGYQCHVFQPCLSFSYNPTASPNCLLTTNPEDAAAAAGWTKYTIEKCSSNITCLLTDQFN
ncbi:uncharacterized protein LOC124144760 [Haliotis rufescens]|uniref:uncharacterized protein LOC124144760 n=1 Tax=Haliotis rufescens TaxID=6454 RepID=UPI00201F8A01|nr:uncharacterized protein LOC124144760 [Haliotis rufescens]